MTVHVESNAQLTLEQERVYRLRNALERDGGTPGGFLELLAAVVTDNTWRQVPSGVNTHEPFTSFKDFIESKPPYGLGHRAADVYTLLKIRHPHESVADFRSKMDAARAEVIRLLALDGITDYTEEQRARDVKAWSALDQAGGWWLGFFVACQVHPGESEAGSSKITGRGDRSGTAGPQKVSARRFAELAGTSSARVMRYYRAWEAASAAGAVSMPIDALYPGHEPIELPAAEEWGRYYTSRQGGSTERGALITAAAEAEGIRPTKALEVAENPTALRAAILGDPKTAETARTALMDRMNDDTELQVAIARTLAAQPAMKKVLATESRKADQVEYLRKVVHDGNAKTPAGLTIDLPEATKAQALEHLAAVEDPATDPQAIAVAYDAVHVLINEVIEADPDIQTREQRSRFHKALTLTAKSIGTIDPDDLIAVADDDLRESITTLQRQVNVLADLVIEPNPDRRNGQ